MDREDAELIKVEEDKGRTNEEASETKAQLEGMMQLIDGSWEKGDREEGKGGRDGVVGWIVTIIMFTAYGPKRAEGTMIWLILNLLRL